MHLTKNTGEKPIDRRSLGNNINYQMNDCAIGQRRISPATSQVLRCRASIDSCASNGTTIKHHF
jgi:hypothetical protein